MSHFCIYISKTLVMEIMESVKNGEDLDSVHNCHMTEFNIQCTLQEYTFQIGG